MTLKNRLVRSATEQYMANPKGYVNEGIIELYRSLAKSGLGLIVTSHICVAEGGEAHRCQLMIDDDRFIQGLGELCRAVKEHGGGIVAQLNHVGEKINREVNRPQQLIAPSGEGRANLASPEQLEYVRESFIQAALRAKRAGFDGVQLHMAHGYLLNQFMDPEKNRRTDAYGGSVENRFRLTGEIISGIRRACGEDYPIFVKLNCNSRDEAGYDFLSIVKLLSALDVEAIELSGYDFLAYDGKYSRPFYLTQALEAKKICNTPLILTGGLRDGESIQRVIDSGIDAVGLSRALLREPDFAQRIREQPEHVSPCIRCSQCIKAYSTLYKHCIFDKVPDEELVRLFAGDRERS